MPLAFGKSSPRDMLAKAKRDLARLRAAEASEDGVATGDALMDVAIALDSARLWLNGYHKRAVKAGSSPFTKAALAVLESALELSSYTNIANEYKHSGASRDASTSEVLLSVPSSHFSRDDSASFSRLKVTRSDLSRHRATDLAAQGIQTMESFMDKHSVV